MQILCSTRRRGNTLFFAGMCFPLDLSRLRPSVITAGLQRLVDVVVALLRGRHPLALDGRKKTATSSGDAVETQIIYSMYAYVVTIALAFCGSENANINSTLLLRYVCEVQECRPAKSRQFYPGNCRRL